MRQLCIRVAIPHYFNPGRAGDEIGIGFGARQTNELRRSCSLFQCLSSIFNLRRTPFDSQLLIRNKTIETVRSSVSANRSIDRIEFEVCVCVYKSFFLKDVLSFFPSVRVVECSSHISDPNQLGLAARDFLLNRTPIADLSVYMEDDLVIHDPLFFDKSYCFLDQFGPKHVLMPHRYEVNQRINTLSRLYIDGPIAHEAFEPWHQPEVSHKVWNCPEFGCSKLKLDKPQNPHSGFFALNQEQVMHLLDCKRNWPVDGFISPLETASTYTVGKFFDVLKTSVGQFSLFSLEHASPSFLGYTSQ